MDGMVFFVLHVCRVKSRGEEGVTISRANPDGMAGVAMQGEFRVIDS